MYPDYPDSHPRPVPPQLTIPGVSGPGPADPGNSGNGNGHWAPNFWLLLLSVVVQTIARIQLWVAWQLEWAYSTAFSILCFFTRRASRARFEPESTAVVVMGAGEGLGRMLALKLATAGYTVFACLPHDIPTPVGHRTTSSISPLLYVWHSRKAQSSDTIEGTIVPLVFDPSAPEECERAKDTIRAYCTQHDVTLRTLLVPPMEMTPPRTHELIGANSANVSPGLSPVTSTFGLTTVGVAMSGVGMSAGGGALWKPTKRTLQPTTQLLQTSQTTMHDAMSKSIFQPLGLVQALAGMLHEARSQVLFISGCDESSFRPSQGVSALCDAARERTAETLQAELSPLGIQVSHVVVGPLQSRAVQTANPEYSGSVGWRRILAFISLLWAIDEQTCFKLVKSAIEARYPRLSYHFGIDVLAQDIALAYFPANFLDLARRAIPNTA
ncbi:hypothetical protein DL93DRAFT_2077115 [Clavulina sp. PMI_390]|nr:hypothetical protein DL93DRAFT_2077115 [Clavulina sp. PMI_390]